MKKATALISIFFLLAVGGMLAQAAEKKGMHDDAEFVKKVASGGMMEVELGKLAQQKARSREVKAFASRMVTDHGRANDELKRIAQQKNMKLPEKMKPKHQAIVDKLAKVSGDQFDKAYMKEMVRDHAKDVAKFRKASDKVKDPDLANWVKKTLPVLEQHSQNAKDIAKKMGIDVSKVEQEGEMKEQRKDHKEMHK